MKDKVHQSRALEGLPPKFVTAMRTLFDVLDDNKSGTVSLADIEHWWRKDKDEHGGSVPQGVIESLRKVATADSSLLTFERFCAGLKICLLRSNAGNSEKEMTDSPSEPEDNNYSRVSELKKHRYHPQSPTPQPPPVPAVSMTMKASPQGQGQGPPKPPRSSFTDNSSRRLGDGGAASDGDIASANNNNNSGRKQPKRRESHSRRHTLQNGIDYSLLKKMKAIEEERDALMRGLQMVQRADEWYQDQLTHVNERMRSLGKAGGGQADNPGATEAARERILFQNARIHEVNQHLNCLMSSDMSFPMSINLAVGAGGQGLGLGHNKDRDVDKQVTRLKDQNRLLTDEVSKKCKAIAVLDQEKSALIRDLFQARARLRQAELNEGEATFM